MAKEIEEIAGITTASNPAKAEEDFIKGLLAAAEFKNDEALRQPITIRRAGKEYFTFTVRPLSNEEFQTARKKATKYMPNPQNRKLPPIEKDFDNAAFHYWLIYFATIDEDREKVWNNAELKKQFCLIQPIDSIELLLMPGERTRIVDLIMDISGLSADEELTTEDAVKN